MWSPYLLSTLALTARLASATPLPLPTNFLLVTTPQCETTANSSQLANVSATSLFDPFDQQDYLLRLIGPGYGSLPTFNLTRATLQTLAAGPENVGTFEYNMTKVVAGSELEFVPAAEPVGNVGLRDGYLVTVGGEAGGWTICPGPLGESVIYWKGNSSDCVATYIHAVHTAPY